MKRFTKTVAIAVSLLALFALVGCAGGGAKEEAANKMATGVWGYVASAKQASLDIVETQRAATEIVVRNVVAPEDAWIVVHDDEGGKPGKRVGLAHVNKGENAEVRVALNGTSTPKVIVAVHADRGTPKNFDFDMDKAMQSADRPFFVGGKELAKIVQVR